MSESLVNVPVNDIVKKYEGELRILLELLKDKFKPPVVTPSMSINEIMYTSGQYSVLTHFEVLLEQIENEKETR
jgi:hypothetical protein